MKKHTLFIALALIFIQSCQKETATVEEKNTVNASFEEPIRQTDTVRLKASPDLQTFPMPAEVEGCSCYFAANKEDYENEKYIYVDDYGKSAFIKMEGKMIKIPMQEGDLDPANFEKNIENSDFKITLSGKKINEMDETMMFRGQMTVLNKKTGKQITTPVYGECGC